MANDGMLRVNFGDLAGAGGDIQAAINSLQTNLADVESAGGKLTASWEGKAKEAYEDRQRIWRDASRSLQDILVQIRGAVESSADDYLATERQATQRFQ